MNKAKVWFIDDEPHGAIDTLVRALEACGSYEVKTFGTEPEIDAAIANQWDRPNVVVIDMMMPVGDPTERAKTAGGRYAGARLLGKLRIDRPFVPIIILSQLSHAEILEVVWDEYITWCTRCGVLTKTGPKEAVLKDEFKVDVVNKSAEAPFLFEQRVAKCVVLG